jgi:DNA-binding NtrC family response regulator
MPPLRERPEDIPLLVWSMVELLGATMNRSVESIRRQDMEQLQRYAWPGNVRELRNMVERALILGSGPVLRIAPPVVSSHEGDPIMSLDEALRGHITRAIEVAGGRISGPGGAAELLGLKPTTLRSKMQRLGLDPSNRRDDRSSQ